MKVNELLLSLFKKSNPEQIALYHIGTVSESLSSLIKNERHDEIHPKQQNSHIPRPGWQPVVPSERGSNHLGLHEHKEGNN